MSESPQHLKLVRIIRDAIRSRNDIVPSLVEAEDHEGGTTTISMPEGYRPDVYYNDGVNIILGEAKISDDLSNMHSEAQFKSYFKYLNSMSSNSVKATLYVGIPWADFAWANNYFRKIKPKNVSVIIINDFSLKKEL